MINHQMFVANKQSTVAILPTSKPDTHYFHASNTLVQFTLPAYLLSFSFSPLFAGPYSDVVGRKKIIVSGLLVGSIATVLCLFATNIWWLIIGRVIQGIGLGAVVSTSRAMMPDRFPDIKKRAKVASMIGTAFPIVLAVAPVIGGWIQEWFNWQAVFAIFLIYILLVLFLAMIKLPETNTRLKALRWRDILLTYIKLFKIKGFILYALIPSFVMFGVGAYMTVSPYLFQHILALSPSEYGMLAIAMGSMIMLSSIVNVRLINKYSSRMLLCVSIGFMFSASFLLLLLHLMELVNVGSVVVACMLYFACIGFAMSNAYALAFKYLDENYGVAMAIISTFQMLSITLSSSIVSLLPEDNVLSLFGMFGVGGGLMVMVLLATRQLSSK